MKELVGILQVDAEAMDGLERELVMEMTLGADATAVLAPRKKEGEEEMIKASAAYELGPSTPNNARGGGGNRGGRGGRGRGGRGGRGGGGGRGGMNEHMRKLVEAGYTQGSGPRAVSTSTRGAHK